MGELCPLSRRRPFWKCSWHSFDITAANPCIHLTPQSLRRVLSLVSYLLSASLRLQTSNILCHKVPGSEREGTDCRQLTSEEGIPLFTTFLPAYFRHRTRHLININNCVPYKKQHSYFPVSRLYNHGQEEDYRSRRLWLEGSFPLQKEDLEAMGGTSWI